MNKSMKKLRIGVIALFAVLLGFQGVFAQSSNVVTAFEYPEDDYVVYLNRFLNIGMIKAVVCGDSLANREYDIELVVCRDGDFERKNLTEGLNFTARSDSLAFYFIAQPLSPDKVRVEFYGPLGHKEEIVIDTTNSLLIEPERSAGYGYGESIPLMAYSPGILQEVEINGKIFQGMDVCGVRYSEIPPSEWHDKFGIKDYLYFELVPKPQGVERADGNSLKG